jgi:hypothetical protein
MRAWIGPGLVAPLFLRVHTVIHTRLRYTVIHTTSQNTLCSTPVQTNCNPNRSRNTVIHTHSENLSVCGYLWVCFDVFWLLCLVCLWDSLSLCSDCPSLQYLSKVFRLPVLWLSSVSTSYCSPCAWFVLPHRLLSGCVFIWCILAVLSLKYSVLAGCVLSVRVLSVCGLSPGFLSGCLLFGCVFLDVFGLPVLFFSGFCVLSAWYSVCLF